MVLWLLRPDVVEFSQMLKGELEGSAEWRRIEPGLKVGPVNESLHSLIKGSVERGGGACLRLKSGGPIIQFLGSWLHEPGDPGAEAGQSAATLRSGTISVSWSTGETDALQRRFVELTKTVYAVMRKCTLPDRVLWRGQPYRRSRIGKATLELVRNKGIVLRDTASPGSELELRESMP